MGRFGSLFTLSFTTFGYVFSSTFLYQYVFMTGIYLSSFQGVMYEYLIIDAVFCFISTVRKRSQPVEEGTKVKRLGKVREARNKLKANLKPNPNLRTPRGKTAQTNQSGQK